MINISSCKIDFLCHEGDEAFHTGLSFGADSWENTLLQKRSVASVSNINRPPPPTCACTHKPRVQYPTRLSVVLLRAQRYILLAWRQLLALWSDLSKAGNTISVGEWELRTKVMNPFTIQTCPGSWFPSDLICPLLLHICPHGTISQEKKIQIWLIEDKMLLSAASWQLSLSWWVGG